MSRGAASPAKLPADGSVMARYSGAERDLLQAVRELVRADHEMRQRMGERLQINATDLRAMRFVIESYRRQAATTPRSLAEHLQVSTAAVTTLLDRLVARGHLLRTPHPSDGRSKVVVPTSSAWSEVQEELGDLHARMARVARRVPRESRASVLAFLTDLAAEMNRYGTGAG